MAINFKTGRGRAREGPRERSVVGPRLSPAVKLARILEKKEEKKKEKERRERDYSRFYNSWTAPGPLSDR